MKVEILEDRHDLLVAAALRPERYPCLMQSAAAGAPLGCWDILPAFPQRVLRLEADGRVHDGKGRCYPGSFLQTLDQALGEPSDVEPDPAAERLPFAGGWAVYLGYELVGELEPRLALPMPTGGPIAMACECPAAMLRNRCDGVTVLVAEPGFEDCIGLMRADLERPWQAPPLPSTLQVAEDPPQQFLDSVARIHRYLRSGDVFQVNLSRRWHATLAKAPTAAEMYAALRGANPAPFAALWQTGGIRVVSSSPERLVEKRGTTVRTRPIAGTRPRLRDSGDPARLAELGTDPKERSEHVMLVDLERNDLGRVCVPGSVVVEELMVSESYADVHHLVSGIRGTLRDDATVGELIGAVFPGGTITGCPKVRCMEIIAELEGVARGAYTGSIGYVDRRGQLDLNILIRTLGLEGDTVSLRAGAGIVADSVAERELEETRAKARGVLRALGITP